MSSNSKTRKPAVAGAFYPSSPKALRDDVNMYLANAGASAPSGPVAGVIIAPHAGYVFSAPVAAAAYARIPRNVKTVILIGPSHRKMFDGVHVSGADFYETPLGSVPVNKDIVNKLSAHPLCLSVEGAEAGEHCLEAQLPFLQVLLDGFTVVPLITGRVSAEAVAEMLLPFVNDGTLVVASSDLSHYLPQGRAREADDATLATILSGNAEGFMDGCGETAMRAVMAIAAKTGLAAELLDARTSYETAPRHGDSNRVVGYAAVIFVKPDTSVKAGGDFTQQEKEYLLKLSRETLEGAVNKKNTQATKPSDPGLSRLAQNYGSFVTLKSRGNLRGCIGNIEPVKPLYKSVAGNTVSAAFHDPRFPEVKPSELGGIKIEISILTKPQPLQFDSPDDLLSKLVPLEHGVILKFGARQSTFLPQVWEQLPDREMFLQHLSMKAGMGSDDWKRAEVWTYRTVHFEE